MTRTSRLTPWLVLAALAPLSLVWAQQAAPAADPLQQQLEQQQAVSERQRTLLAEIRDSITSLSAEEQATLKELDGLNADIDRLRGQTEVLDVKLRQTETRLGVTQRDILGLETRVGQLRNAVSLNLNSLYRERTGEYLALLAQAQSLSDLLLRLRWANYAGDQQVATIQELDREVGRLEAQLASQEKDRQELRALQSQREDALAELATRQTEVQALLAELRQTAEGQRLLELQGQAELAQTGENIATLLDAAVSQQEQLEAQRQRELEAQRQREAEAAARLREAEVARQRALAAAAAATPRAAQPSSSASATSQSAARTPSPAKSTAPSASPSPSAARPTPVPQTSPPQTPAAPAQAAAPNAARPSQTSPSAASRPAPTAAAPSPSAPQPAPAVSAELPTPAQLTEARTQAETQVQLTEAQLAPLRGRLDSLEFPLPGGQVTEPYTPGSPWAVIQSFTERQASAAAEGAVLAVTSFSSLGWVVLLDHGDGLVTAYLGLSDTAVQVGERVPQGAPLGQIGGSPVFGPDAMAFQVSRVEGDQRTPLPPPF